MLTLRLSQLPRGMLLRPAGGLSLLPDPPDAAAVADLLRPGLEDVGLVEEVTAPCGRRVRFLPMAELDEPENLTASQMLGYRVHGPVAVMPKDY